MGKGGTALGIVAIILSAGAIGFTFIVWNGQNTTNNLTRTIVVGIWDNLDENLDYAPHNLQKNWLFEFGDNNLSNTDYISVSNTNTRITLLKSGWYRIHLSVLLRDITSSNLYYITLYKNGEIESYLDFYETPSTIGSLYDYLKLSTFVYSNSTNYIEISGYCYSGSFEIWNNDPDFNQFTIEYVVI